MSKRLFERLERLKTDKKVAGERLSDAEDELRMAQRDYENTNRRVDKLIESISTTYEENLLEDFPYSPDLEVGRYSGGGQFIGLLDNGNVTHVSYSERFSIPQSQLGRRIVWEPDLGRGLGGYRYLDGDPEVKLG